MDGLWRFLVSRLSYRAHPRGSTLALAYSQTHPDRVQALILRGIFLFRKAEIDFFWRSGTRCEFDHTQQMLIVGFWPAEW